MSKEHPNNINQELNHVETKKIALDENRFAEAQNNFLRQVKKAPDITSRLEKEQEASFGDMMLGILEFCSIYRLEKSTPEVETAMKKLISKKVKEKDPHYEFASKIFLSKAKIGDGKASYWEMFFTHRLSMSSEKNKWSEEIFYKNHSWERSVHPDILKSTLPALKNPNNNKQLKAVFEVAKDLIGAF